MSERKEGRSRLNAETLSTATHHGEPWSSDEIDLLMEFWPAASGLSSEEREVAEALGRTIEACRQRFYEARAGRARVVEVKGTTTTTTTTTTVSTRYIGAADDPDDCFWSPDYYK